MNAGDPAPQRRPDGADTRPSHGQAREARGLGAPPQTAVYGASTAPPRGDYDRGGLVSANYTCLQNYAAYTQADHEIYRRLYRRQSALLPGLACDEFIAALPSLGQEMGNVDRIPRFEDINERLFKATGWEVVAVPGLIPEVPFFTLLADRKFPVTDWIRTPAEFDYIVEPDIFHDLFGHVPLLFNPVFADHMQAYGAGGLKAHGLGACEQLSRLYWYTIEFGLIRQRGEIRAYGAGILSSAGELAYAVTSPAPRRMPLELLRAMRTRYKIDSFQQSYFVIESFQQLLDMTAPDFTPLYDELKTLEELLSDGAQAENAQV